MKIGVLTGGGDCPGLNAAIRAIVKYGSKRYGDSFLGVKYGWKGLVNKSMPNEERVMELTVSAENLISGKGLGSDVVQSRVGAAARGMRLTDLKVASEIKRSKY
jgi:6-phosphofructokinase